MGALTLYLDFINLFLSCCASWATVADRAEQGNDRGG